jgi:hypothetical protein
LSSKFRGKQPLARQAATATKPQAPHLRAPLTRVKIGKSILSFGTQGLAGLTVKLAYCTQGIYTIISAL